jgi:alkaline phosphatase/alkaline phosphatase D
MLSLLVSLATGLGLSAPAQSTETQPVTKPAIPYDAMGEKSGEVTADSVILHTRLTAAPKGDVGQAIPGAAGRVRFEYSTDPDFAASRLTDWQAADAARDYTVQVRVTSLVPATKYYYRVHIAAAEGENVRIGPVRRFATAPAADVVAPVRFAAITGQRFPRRDSDEGFFSYRQMLKVGIDFITPTGDNVYYDELGHDVPTARMHWHRTYSLPILVDFYGRVPGYWEKDDHDYRFDDADRYRNRSRVGSPTHQEGIEIFLEQHPLASPTYHTYRWGKGLQIWLVEGRDYRSRNAAKDGPDKTIWGAEQKAWLKRTLLASDAMFKVLVSPTPMVGPDYARKRDNHVNPRGFRHEGTEFFNWLRANAVRNFIIVCGDRHWRYHSVHPSGYHEFCTGALSDEHMLVYDPARCDGAIPGTEVLYGNTELVGGFLLVGFEPAEAVRDSRLVLEHMTWKGDVEHRYAFPYVP